MLASRESPVSTPNSLPPVTAIAASASSSNTIYVAAGGAIFVTTNDGITWNVRSVPGASDNISSLAVDPTNSQIVYATRGLFNNSSDTGYVFRSTNGGKSWTDITSDLPNLPVNAIALNVAAGSTQIWVGTDAGVYYSSDLGESWGSYRTGLPNAQVVSLTYNPILNILLAGTNGRVAWEIKSAGAIGITPLSQPPAVEGTPETFSSLGTFIDTGGNDPLTNYSVVINWGDGSTNAGTITGTGPFNISDTHTYTEFGTYQVVMMVTDVDGAIGQATDTITVNDAPITATAIATTLAAVEGSAFTGAVATFTDGNPDGHLSDFSATINWGDGSTSNGQISYDANNSTYTIDGTHTYPEFGNYPVSVAVADKGGSTSAASELMVVADAPLSPVPLTFTSIEGSRFTGTVGTFTDANSDGTVTDYTATIDWGDNTTTFGATIERAGLSTFDVLGTHVYTQYGTYTVSITVDDAGEARPTS